MLPLHRLSPEFMKLLRVVIVDVEELFQGLLLAVSFVFLRAWECGPGQKEDKSDPSSSSKHGDYRCRQYKGCASLPLLTKWLALTVALAVIAPIDRAQ